MKKTVTATEARKNFYKLLDKASQPGQHITITRQGKDPVIMLSQEEIESWQETIEVMSDPQLVKNIEAAKKSKDFTPLDEVLNELGWRE